MSTNQSINQSIKLSKTYKTKLKMSSSLHITFIYTHTHSHTHTHTHTHNKSNIEIACHPFSGIYCHKNKETKIGGDTKKGNCYIM